MESLKSTGTVKLKQPFAMLSTCTSYIHIYTNKNPFKSIGNMKEWML